MNTDDIQLVPKAPVDETISREEWQTAPLKTARNWLVGFGSAAVLILAVLYGAYLYMRPAAVVADTKPAIAVAGIPATTQEKQLSAKIAIKNKATQVINTPAIAINSHEIIPSAEPAEPLTPAEQDFANRLAIFESKTP